MELDILCVLSQRTYFWPLITGFQLPQSDNISLFYILKLFKEVKTAVKNNVGKAKMLSWYI